MNALVLLFVFVAGFVTALRWVSRLDNRLLVERLQDGSIGISDWERGCWAGISIGTVIVTALFLTIVPT